MIGSNRTQVCARWPSLSVIALPPHEVGRLVGRYGLGLSLGSATTEPAAMRAVTDGSCGIPAGKLLDPNEIPGTVHGACAQGLWAVPAGFGLTEYCGELAKITPISVSCSIIHCKAPSDSPLSSWTVG